MSLAFVLASYVFMLAVAWIEVRKRWLLGSFIALNSVLSMAVFDYIVADGLRTSDFVVNYTSFTAMPMDGLEAFSVPTRIMFIAVSAMVLVSSRGESRRVGRPDHELQTAISFGLPQLIEKYESVIALGLVAINLLNIAHLLSMDTSVLWHNTSYLTVKTAEDIGITNPAMAIYHQGHRILAIFTILGYYALSWKIAPGKKFLCMTYSLYAVVIMMAGSSRWIFLYGVVAIFAAYVLGKLTIVRGITLTLASIIGFQYAIYSRSLNDFGLSRIIPNLTEINLDFILRSSGALIVNTFEGALNFANSLRIEPAFDSRYQILSLSPFPNAIDGFDANSGVGINIYAPMGGLGELVFFSWPIQLVFVAVIGSFLRLAYQVDRYGNVLLRYAITFAGVYAAYILPSYSVRTTWKIFIFLLIVLIAWRVSRRNLGADDAGARPGPTGALSL